MNKYLNFGLKIFIIIFITLLVFVTSSFWYFSAGLPNYKKLSNYQPPISSRLYSDNGKLIGEYALEKRLFVPFEAIPKNIINSFLSAEDKNFFKHPGVDAKSILRAIFKNIKNLSNNKRPEGASTITQQVAKNFLLTNEVSIKRKIKEAILAFRIERAYSKERILELYLNQIYLGQGAYGIAAASLEYFNKSVKDLDYSEAALLAALPKAPSKYDPYKNYNEAKFRRNLVIKNLKENGYLSDEEYKLFSEKKINLQKRKIEILNEAKSYTEEVRKFIKNKYGFEQLYTQGLNIQSPLNVKYQLNAVKALRKGIEDYDKRQGWKGPITNKNSNKNWKRILEKIDLDPTLEWDTAEVTKILDNKFLIKILNKELIGEIDLNDLSWIRTKKLGKVFKEGDIIFVKKKKNNSWSLKQYPKINGGMVAIEPFTGEIKALVGGFSFKKSEFNRVTQAKRQPGSAFKPIVYAAALENGFLPNTMVLDAPLVAKQGTGLKNWKPENYGKKFYGPSTLRKGIEYSRNLMTVRIAEKLGLNKILELSQKLNIYEDTPELLSVSLGSVETTLLNLTSAYATFVNGGKKVDPKLINRIQDRRGKTIFKTENISCSGCDTLDLNSENLPTINLLGEKVISSETAFQMTSILEGVIQRGTGKKLKNLKLPLAGKTGTTNNNFDAWFIGYTSNLVVGVYVGFDEPKTLGKYETGSKAALPIFKNFIEKSLSEKKFKNFNVPENIYFASINYDTGLRSNFNDKKSIVEAFKSENIKTKSNNNLNNLKDYAIVEKFKKFY